MMRRILGSPGASAVSMAAMISIFAALNGSILSGSRVPYAAARDGLFFHAHRAGPSAIFDAVGFHSGAQRVGGAAGFIGAVRTIVYVCHLCELDFVRNDNGCGDCSALEKAGFTASVSNHRIPLGSR